ncbi:MAG: hypothetical protein Ct9H300mP28_07050 [Pseudomonadota bacterium]|nr:MAG: hypothetical protein Ct9H300mP28_07050 [Pseudomonadota bacterium]
MNDIYGTEITVEQITVSVSGMNALKDHCTGTCTK